MAGAGVFGVQFSGRCPGAIPSIAADLAVRIPEARMTSTLMPAGTPAARVFGESHLRTDGDLLLVAFTPDGSLWSLESSGRLRRWTKTGEPISVVELSDLEIEWAFSKDMRVVASGSKELSLWDASSGQVLTAVRQDSWITALAFNADAAFLATGHDDGSIRYWDLAGHSAVHTFRHHKMPISALAFHADGKTLAAASEDRTITLWSIETGKHLGALAGHTDRIPALAWHPARKVLVSAGWDTTARVWDTDELKPLILLNNHASQVTSLAFSPDGNLLASADSGRNIHIWDGDKFTLRRALTGPAVEIRSLAFAPDNSTLAVTGDRVIHFWNAVTGQPLLGSEERSRVKPSISVSRDGTLLASNTSGQACKIWDIGTRQLQRSLIDAGQIHQVEFSPAAALIAAACGTTVRVWDSATGQLHLELDGPDDPLAIVAFSPDGTVLAASGYQNPAVWIWSVRSGEPLLIIPDPLEGCAPMDLAFHPDGKVLAVAGVDWLATGGSTGALSLWDLKERLEVNSLIDGSTAVAFHPTGDRLAASTLDRTIGLYDAASLDLQAELLGHDGALTCLAYSPDGKLLASGSDDHTIRLWNADGEEVAVIEVASKVTALVFSPSGESLFAAHANTTCSQYGVAQAVNS
jgi:WD40 repeat protein